MVSRTHDIACLFYLIKWLAIDDDANSSIRTGDLIKYRDDTIKIVRSSLSAQAQDETSRHPDPRIESYREVGRAIRSCGDTGNADSDFSRPQMTDRTIRIEPGLYD